MSSKHLLAESKQTNFTQSLSALCVQQLHNTDILWLTWLANITNTEEAV